MTTQRAVLIQSQDTPIVQTDLYTSTGVTSTIDKLTATNTTAGTLTISINLIPSAGAAGATNLIAKTISILAAQSYQFPEIVGHDLAPGDKISGIASATGSTVRCSGRITTPN